MNQEQHSTDSLVADFSQELLYSVENPGLVENESPFSRMFRDPYLEPKSYYSRFAKIERESWSYFVSLLFCLAFAFGGGEFLFAQKGADISYVLSSETQTVFLGQNRSPSGKKKTNILSPIVSFFKKDNDEVLDEDLYEDGAADRISKRGAELSSGAEWEEPEPWSFQRTPIPPTPARTNVARESIPAAVKREFLHVRNSDPAMLQELLEELAAEESVNWSLAEELIAELRSVKPSEASADVYDYMVSLVRTKLLPNLQQKPEETETRTTFEPAPLREAPPVKTEQTPRIGSSRNTSPRNLSTIHVTDNEPLEQAQSKAQPKTQQKTEGTESRKPVAPAPIPERELPNRENHFARSPLPRPDDYRDPYAQQRDRQPLREDRSGYDIPHGNFNALPEDEPYRRSNGVRQASYRGDAFVRPQEHGGNSSPYTEASYREPYAQNYSANPYTERISENGSDWQMHTVAAINALKTRINLAPSAEAATADEVRLRILESTLGVRRDQTRPIPGMSEPLQNFLSHESFALAMLMNEKEHPELEKRVLSSESHFQEANRFLKQNCPLKIRNLQFIKSRTTNELQSDDFRGFGLYTPVKPEFRTGDPATVYMELENLSYTGNETVHYTSSITWSYEIFDATGSRLLQRERDQGETLRTPRRDVAIAIMLELKDLPVGHYYMLVRIVDKNSVTQLSMDTQRLSFSVKAPEGDAKPSASR